MPVVLDDAVQQLPQQRDPLGTDREAEVLVPVEEREATPPGSADLAGLVLEPISEEDFDPCSYGFRPNRRAHSAGTFNRAGTRVKFLEGPRGDGRKTNCWCSFNSFLTVLAVARR